MRSFLQKEVEILKLKQPGLAHYVCFDSSKQKDQGLQRIDQLPAYQTELRRLPLPSGLYFSSHPKNYSNFFRLVTVCILEHALSDKGACTLRILKSLAYDQSKNNLLQPQFNSLESSFDVNSAPEHKLNNNSAKKICVQFFHLAAADPQNGTHKLLAKYPILLVVFSNLLKNIVFDCYHSLNKSSRKQMEQIRIDLQGKDVYSFFNILNMLRVTLGLDELQIVEGCAYKFAHDSWLLEGSSHFYKVTSSAKVQETSRSMLSSVYAESPDCSFTEEVKPQSSKQSVKNHNFTELADVQPGRFMSVSSPLAFKKKSSLNILPEGYVAELPGFPYRTSSNIPLKRAPVAFARETVLTSVSKTETKTTAVTIPSTVFESTKQPVKASEIVNTSWEKELETIKKDIKQARACSMKRLSKAEEENLSRSFEIRNRSRRIQGIDSRTGSSQGLIYPCDIVKRVSSSHILIKYESSPKQYQQPRPINLDKMIPDRPAKGDSLHLNKGCVHQQQQLLEFRSKNDRSQKLIKSSSKKIDMGLHQPYKSQSIKAARDIYVTYLLANKDLLKKHKKKL